MKQELVCRLKEEKEQGLKTAHNEGYALGKQDAPMLHYADLKMCGEGKIPTERWHELKGIIHEKVSVGTWEHFTKEDAHAFKQGYLTAVQEFWNEVKEQL